jgi:hypothetical protein
MIRSPAHACRCLQSGEELGEYWLLAAAKVLLVLLVEGAETKANDGRAWPPNIAAIAPHRLTRVGCRYATSGSMTSPTLMIGSAKTAAANPWEVLANVSMLNCPLSSRLIVAGTAVRGGNRQDPGFSGGTMAGTGSTAMG